MKQINPELITERIITENRGITWTYGYDGRYTIVMTSKYGPMPSIVQVLDRCESVMTSDYGFITHIAGYGNDVFDDSEPLHVAEFLFEQLVNSE